MPQSWNRDLEYESCHVARGLIGGKKNEDASSLWFLVPSDALDRVYQVLCIRKILQLSPSTTANEG